MDSHFEKIIKELERQPIPNNRHRLSSGVGQTQTFGVVNRRCCPADFSAFSFERPYLYKLLLDFGSEFITGIKWNAITINQNYKCGIHRDKHNGGDSIIVAFGSFEGGELELHESDLKGIHNIKHKLLQHDFSKTYHSVLPFTGNRYSLVYYNRPTKTELPKPSVKFEENKWVFYRGESKERLTDHPLRRPS
ncbi:MAG: hypothetical protein RL498_387 [Pseudomonadota bacterium]|jgi:hypothetical protein